MRGRALATIMKHITLAKHIQSYHAFILIRMYTYNVQVSYSSCCM
jgi:hypothetical protein